MVGEYITLSQKPYSSQQGWHGRKPHTYSIHFHLTPSDPQVCRAGIVIQTAQGKPRVCMRVSLAEICDAEIQIVVNKRETLMIFGEMAGGAGIGYKQDDNIAIAVDYIGCTELEATMKPYHALLQQDKEKRG